VLRARTGGGHGRAGHVGRPDDPDAAGLRFPRGRLDRARLVVTGRRRVRDRRVLRRRRLVGCRRHSPRCGAPHGGVALALAGEARRLSRRARSRADRGRRADVGRILCRGAAHPRPPRRAPRPHGADARRRVTRAAPRLRPQPRLAADAQAAGRARGVPGGAARAARRADRRGALGAGPEARTARDDRAPGRHRRPRPGRPERGSRAPMARRGRAPTLRGCASQPVRLEHRPVRALVDRALAEGERSTDIHLLPAGSAGPRPTRPPLLRSPRARRPRSGSRSGSCSTRTSRRRTRRCSSSPSGRRRTTSRSRATPSRSRTRPTCRR
jgi:hypothetical protein